jgi:plasmid stabilization system protein ParE
MRAVKFHEAAELEAEEAVIWFEKEAGLGRALREEIEDAIEKIKERPLSYPVVHLSNVRRALTHRFPYSLIFTVEEKFIFIVAVFHSSRDPMIWKGRIG